MNKLLMQVALIDKVTKPLQSITAQVQSAADKSRLGFENMAKGGAGLVAAGFAIQNALMPALEMNRKLNEVKSLGVTTKSLQLLQKTAKNFSLEYGRSATDFVAASYDIQSSISGLNGVELAEFTKSSAVLATATKADVSTITSYVGSMYGIFKSSADNIGKDKWVSMLAGKTAKAVQMFKTTGTKMSSAFSSLGADATAAGISMSEQMAILGKLQATMGGSEAATKYKAFLGGVGEAQGKLNLKFTDSTGKMLPMIQILQKLKGKFGETFDVAESVQLKKAFGSDEAVSLVKLLITDTNSLNSNIKTLGQIKSIDKATAMAKDMTDGVARLSSSFNVIRTTIFSAVLPAMNCVAAGFANGLMSVINLLDKFPVLKKTIGYVSLAVLGFAGVVATASLAMGASQLLMSGWTVTLAVLKNGLGLFRMSSMLATGATWLLNAALMANPVGMVVGGVVLLCSALAATIHWWSDLSDRFKDSSWFNVVAKMITGVVNLLNKLPFVDIKLGKIDSPELKNAEKSKNIKKNIVDAKLVNQSISSTKNIQERVQKKSIAEYKNNRNLPHLPNQMVENVTSTNNHKQQNVKTFGDIYISSNESMTPDKLAEWEELNAG